MSNSITTTTPEQQQAKEHLGNLGGDSLKAIAAKVKHEHEQVKAAFASSLQHAILAGEQLAKVHSSKTYPDFCAWVQKECKFSKTKKISESTAMNYIRLYKNQDDIKVKDAENYVGALKALRKTRKGSPKKPAQTGVPLTEWQAELKEKMAQFKVRGTLVNVELFLASFGVNAPKKE